MAHWYTSFSEYKFRQQWACIPIMICFIRSSRICPGALVNDTTHQPSDSPGGVLQSAARTNSLHHRVRHWHLKRTLDVFGHSRRLLSKPEKVCNRAAETFFFYSRANIRELITQPNSIIIFFIWSFLGICFHCSRFVGGLYLAVCITTSQ